MKIGIITEKISDKKIKIVVGGVIDFLQVYNYLEIGEEVDEVEMIDHLNDFGLAAPLDNKRDPDGCDYILWINNILCKNAGKTQESILVHELIHIIQFLFQDVFEIKARGKTLNELEARYMTALYQEAVQYLVED